MLSVKLSVWLHYRSWSRHSEFQPRSGLCADSSEPGACFRFCVSVSVSLPLPPLHSVSISQKWTLKKLKKKTNNFRGAWVAPSIKCLLQLRSWSHGSWGQAPPWVLHFQHRAHFRPFISLSFCPSPAHALFFSLSKINIIYLNLISGNLLKATAL